MNRQPTERVAEIVEQALELPTVERQKFVTAACGEDVDLRREVGSLLGVEQRARDFIEHTALAAAPEFIAGPGGALKPGENFDDYKIISLINEGGMSEVYLADDTKLRRKVAIKLLKFRLGTASFIRHFQQEEWILAGLIHPNIAQLYGAAVAANGLPYFVMEYVDGFAAGRLLRPTAVVDLTTTGVISENCRCGFLRSPAPDHSSGSKTCEHSDHQRRRTQAA